MITTSGIVSLYRVDDIEDDSELRRGRPVAHRIFGVPWTINCANYVYFISLRRCQQLGNSHAMSVYVEEMLRLHQGQGIDIYWRDQCTCPSIEDYVKMVENSKSSELTFSAIPCQKCVDRDRRSLPFGCRDAASF